MGLRIIYGRAGSGKTRLCLNEIKSNIERGTKRPLILLVPEQFTLKAERDLITTLGTGGILGTEVLSFRRLAFRVFNEAGGIAHPHIHQAGKCMMLHSILNKTGKDFRIFSQSVVRRGLVNKLAALITEFKRYNVAPAQLDELCKSIGEDSQLGLKLSELGRCTTPLRTLSENTLWMMT